MMCTKIAVYYLEAETICPSAGITEQHRLRSTHHPEHPACRAADQTDARENKSRPTSPGPAGVPSPGLPTRRVDRLKEDGPEASINPGYATPADARNPEQPAARTENRPRPVQILSFLSPWPPSQIHCNPDPATRMAGAQGTN